MLCCATVRFAPEVLAAPGLLEQLVAMTLHTGRSYDQEQCKLWLEWVPLLTTAPFVAASWMSSLNQLAPTSSLECSPQQQHVARQAPQSAPAGGLAGRRGSATSPGVVSMAFSLELQQRQEPLELQLSLLPAGLARLVALLDASAGAQLCLALLLAASGDMPPDLIMPIASTLHFIWTWVGTARMSAWLQAAIMDCAPASAPWAGQKADSKAAFLQDLLSQDAECDVGRFKRLIKGFCGGKKKVAGVTSMAGVS